MKIFNSIKWRLQLWYGLILVCVLVGFGFTAYQLERNRLFRHVDDEIHRRVGMLGQALHGPPHGPQQNRPRGDFGPPDFPDDGMPDAGRRPPKFTLPPQVAGFFGADVPNQFFFAIRNRDNIEFAHSENAPQNDDAYFAVMPANGPGNFKKSPELMRVGDEGFFVEGLPSGEKIIVGGSVAPELHELGIAAFKLAGFGGIVLFLGLLGGWWFVGRSLRPISEISLTAAKISAGDLAQRINMEEAESELGQLAAVLNSTFARLETAFAQQKQFASDAAHELRTPVSVILTQTQSSLSRERDSASYRQTVEACQRAAQRMRKLIESLLELARFDAGQEVLQRMDFDLSKTISESVDLVQTMADEKKIKIFTGLESLRITGDSGRLGQVVTNLLTNAIQYNKPDGEVRIELKSENGLAVLRVSDTGNGIAPEDLPRVFERFYRAEKSRTGAGNSGLGLSICKAIVEAHGGTIEAARENGSGAIFTVRLPASS